ncbi:unnamed protein product [Eruca vesicaria subsp. sativa]|uniref:Uncharacterized protein n=1 Tax=Eruca vesicaria subsp. sativa TaxID=29727 RepID=A0ABC8L1H2_ERUVS|nr:unnamed protein product [Eruca vesicaria subsp. sativa]
MEALPTGHATHKMQQRLRGPTKINSQSYGTRGIERRRGMSTPQKQATQVGKRELSLNAEDAFTIGCPQNPKVLGGAPHSYLSLDNERRSSTTTLKLHRRGDRVE